MNRYQFLMHQTAYDQAGHYLAKLQQGLKRGKLLQSVLAEQAIDTLTVSQFLDCLINTKKPQIFAESAVCGDGSDWTPDELSLLGDIGVAVPVTVYDNGRHTHPDIHEPPIQATLLFIPGALLRNGQRHTPADWNAVVIDDRINFEGFYNLYARRLLPLFDYANQTAKESNQKALITVPGLGCGQFAGPFSGQLGELLNQAIKKILKTNANRFPHIRAVYFDPYHECENERTSIEEIDYLVRPLTKGNSDKPQLCTPITYEEDGDDFSHCALFSVVAWDHVSWPGNDFYIGSRATDDGVKAAATDAMAAITGIFGHYDPPTFCYLPPEDNQTWENVVNEKQIHLKMKENLLIS